MLDKEVIEQFQQRATPCIRSDAQKAVEPWLAVLRHIVGEQTDLEVLRQHFHTLEVLALAKQRAELTVAWEVFIYHVLHYYMRSDKHQSSDEASSGDDESGTHIGLQQVRKFFESSPSILTQIYGPELAREISAKVGRLAELDQDRNTSLTENLLLNTVRDIQSRLAAQKKETIGPKCWMEYILLIAISYDVFHDDEGVTVVSELSALSAGAVSRLHKGKRISRRKALRKLAVLEKRAMEADQPLR